MTEQVRLYISAASDLEGEREILGRAVTEIPVDLGWRISQSPRRNDPVDEDAVVRADVHVLLLGSDIRAPVGLEWLAARRAGQQPLPFLKRDVRRTPAAMEFIRYIESQASWQPFYNGADLRRKVLVRLADHILDRAVTYRLSPMELESLRAWRSELTASPSAADEETRGGAGESGLILSQERYVPSEGILIQPGKDEAPNEDDA
ncbi:MAG: hypothetical protein M3220_04530 [Chloroflexota bacterium]|nr:hypothetical protein [Chloroflexota bacterium]